MRIPRGTLIAGRYRVESALGKGGMGEVYAAENTRTGRRVALKVLRAESRKKASAIERFRREARAAGAIRSEFVTQVLDVDDDDEHGIVLVFELLEGESLVERLKRTGPIPLPELWGIVEAVWAGLAAAHAAGIIHRDLKPSNVHLESRSGMTWVKLLDFGISKLPKDFGGDSLTQLGQSLGTFSFMPPEQIGRAKVVDHRADIYACATLVFQSLTGKLPFSGKNSVEMLELKTKSAPMALDVALGRPVDARLAAFVAKGLARDPDDRFQTALEALEAWRTLRPPGATSIVERYETGDVPSSPPSEANPASEAMPPVSPARAPAATMHLAHEEFLAAPSSEGATLVRLPDLRPTNRGAHPTSRDDDPSRASETVRIPSEELARWVEAGGDPDRPPAAAPRAPLHTEPLPLRLAPAAPPPERNDAAASVPHASSPRHSPPAPTPTETVARRATDSASSPASAPQRTTDSAASGGQPLVAPVTGAGLLEDASGAPARPAWHYAVAALALVALGFTLVSVGRWFLG